MLDEIRTPTYYSKQKGGYSQGIFIGWGLHVFELMESNWKRVSTLYFCRFTLFQKNCRCRIWVTFSCFTLLISVMFFISVSACSKLLSIRKRGDSKQSREVRMQRTMPGRMTLQAVSASFYMLDAMLIDVTFPRIIPIMESSHILGKDVILWNSRLIMRILNAKLQWKVTMMKTPVYFSCGTLPKTPIMTNRQARVSMAMRMILTQYLLMQRERQVKRMTLTNCTVYSAQNYHSLSCQDSEISKMPSLMPVRNQYAIMITISRVWQGPYSFNQTRSSSYSSMPDFFLLFMGSLYVLKEIIINYSFSLYNPLLFDWIRLCKFFQYKAKMEKILCLPKISLKDLEGRVREQRLTYKKYNRQQAARENDGNRNHHGDIKITSPFYQRSHHKEKCECRYHRLKREMHVYKRTDKRKGVPIPEGGWRPTEKREVKDKGILLQLTNRVSDLKLISPSKTLQPLQASVHIKIEGESEGEAGQNYNTLQSHSRSIKKLPTRKTFKSLKYKPIPQLMDEVANSRVDALNYEYISMISRRMENEKFKQKYIKTLFGFIRMKSNQDRHYIEHSKAYIQNSLNMLLNHYTMDKLLDYSKLKDEEVSDIGYYMNCFPQKVKGILVDLGRAVSEMERALSQMKKKRKAEEDCKQNEPRIYTNSNYQNGKGDQHTKNHEGRNSLEEYNYKNALTKDSCVSQLDQNNTSLTNNTSTSNQNLQLNSNQDESSLLKNSHKEKHSILRSSSRKLFDLTSNSSSKKEMSQTRSIEGEDSLPRRSVRASQRNQQTMNRSVRSTVLGIVDEVQKETHLTKKKNTAKFKKQLKTKYSEFDQKYLSVPYEKYITKRHFQSLISQLERLDQNDVERGDKIFKALNVETFLDDHERIDEIVKTFKPLFNEKSLHFFLRQVVMVRDRRYIEKLERQLDDMLHEIKKNDPRGVALDFFQIKPEKKVPTYMNKMAKCRQIKMEKEQAISHIKYFEAEQEIQRHMNKQESVKMHLQQIPLRGIHFDTIDPSKSTVITHDGHSPKRSFNHSRETNLPYISDQKKILRYMRQKHEGTFNYLVNQFDNLCKSLFKENQA